MKVRVSLSELITRQESFRHAGKMMERQMKRADKLSEMLQRAQAKTGFLVDEDERPYDDIDDPESF